MLKLFAVTLAAPIADILNISFSECRCLRAWKLDDISVTVFDKDLRPITLTSTLSNIVEAFVINKSGQMREAHSSIINGS